jgi:Rps23 Pro-64 3,4-dihydroxylase Tpa1-like proline 4-hydroxylase
LNTPEFLKHLENLTGIKKLFRDPLLMGGGVHKINRGGKLSIHIDYNNHPKTKQRRKLNLLIYLNKDWDKSWGSNLELWNKELTEKIIEVEPIFNRAVIFTIDDAPHGHPYPLNCPENISRYSLALYYFVDEEPEKKHSVIFYRNDEVGITDNSNSYDKIFKTS